MAKCPILKKLGIKIKKRLAADNSNKSTAHVASEGSSTATPPPAPAPALASDTGGGSFNIPGACTASTEAETYNLGDKFNYEGKYQGAFYAGTVKPSQTHSLCCLDPHSCSHTSSEDTCIATSADVSTICTNSACKAINPKGVTTICLLKHVMTLLNNPPAHSIKTFSDTHHPQTSLLIADTGASNRPYDTRQIHLHIILHVFGTTSLHGQQFICDYLGIGHCSIISLNGKKILIRNCLHVSSLHSVTKQGHLHACNWDEKLIGSGVQSFLHTNKSSIASSPAGCQPGNGIVKAHWKIMVHMSHVYLTEKQMPQSFWYFAIKHAAKKMNIIPKKYKGKLALSFMLVHGVHPDQQAWLTIFSLCYFHHEEDSNASCSKNQAHTLDRIIIRQSPISTKILIYIPRNQKYYKPDSYWLDPYRLPSLVYPKIKCNSSLLVSLRWDEVASISKPFPPGTRVADVHPTTGKTRSGMVMNIPLDPNLSLQYLVLYDDGTSLSIPAASIPALSPLWTF
jgi:hypothetical protein